MLALLLFLVGPADVSIAAADLADVHAQCSVLTP